MTEKNIHSQNTILMQKAIYIYAQIQGALSEKLTKSSCRRVVIGISGGSGSGKTSIAALLKEYMEKDGLGCYVLAGDDYPRRLPKYNDAERLRIYREYGLRGMVDGGVYTPERFARVQQWQLKGEDADFAHAGGEPLVLELSGCGQEGSGRVSGLAQGAGLSEGGVRPGQLPRR